MATFTSLYKMHNGDLVIDVDLDSLVGKTVTINGGTRKGLQAKIIRAWDRITVDSTGQLADKPFKTQYILDVPSGTRQFSNVKF